MPYMKSEEAESQTRHNSQDQEQGGCETCNDTGRIPADHSEGAAGLPCPDCPAPDTGGER